MFIKLAGHLDSCQNLVIYRRFTADLGDNFENTYILPYYHLLLDSAPNLGLLISRWEINKFENC
jgi:hypothetical protein